MGTYTVSFSFVGAPTTHQEVEVRAGEFEDDYNADEDVYAAYAQAEYRLRNWTILGGLRVEDTDFAVNGFGVLEPLEGDPEIIAVSDDSSYSDLFPSLHVHYAATPNIIVRGSWSNTIGRPSFNSLVPATVIVEEDERGSGSR